ncbi:hypothetical protein KC799_08240 [candidate division KSB1 bacterium]|nr:hypothetical protein [candidate division KSB1 bacterium]
MKARMSILMVAVVVFSFSAVSFAQDTTLTVTKEGYIGLRVNPKHQLHFKGYLYLEGSDFFMADPARGNGGRALVHWGNGSGNDDQLVLNFGGDFENGVQVDGPKGLIIGAPQQIGNAKLTVGGAGEFYYGDSADKKEWIRLGTRDDSVLDVDYKGAEGNRRALSLHSDSPDTRPDIMEAWSTEGPDQWVQRFGVSYDGIVSTVGLNAVEGINAKRMVAQEFVSAPTVNGENVNASSTMSTSSLTVTGDASVQSNLNVSGDIVSGAGQGFKIRYGSKVLDLSTIFFGSGFGLSGSSRHTFQGNEFGYQFSSPPTVIITGVSVPERDTFPDWRSSIVVSVLNISNSDFQIGVYNSGTRLITGEFSVNWIAIGQ